MPILKPISGHTGCRNVRRYLEKNGRAIARDFFNLSWDEREMGGYDQAGKEAVEWDREMDRTRASFGNARGGEQHQPEDWQQDADEKPTRTQPRLARHGPGARTARPFQRVEG